MSDVQRWTEALEAELGLSPGTVDVQAVLDLARDAAHAVARPAAPVTTYAVGYAEGLAAGRAAAGAAAGAAAARRGAAAAAGRSGGDSEDLPDPGAPAAGAREPGAGTQVTSDSPADRARRLADRWEP